MDWERFYKLLAGMRLATERAECFFREGDKVGGMAMLLGMVDILLAIQSLTAAHEEEFLSVPEEFRFKNLSIH